MTDRWSREAINDWYGRQPWRCGFNYLPRTAVNWIEQWQADTFDAGTIEEELGWAQDVGFNTLRTNLHSLVWGDDPAGLRGRVDRFLGIAARHGVRTMLCLFDDCEFSGRDSRLGPQGDPVPGMHNSRACGSPGRRVVRDPAQWPPLERYVSDVVGHFRDDARIVAWDVYNEPGNAHVFSPGRSEPGESLLPYSLDLARAATAWARAAGPTQPLTVGVWNPVWSEEENAVLLGLSDVISFHNYGDLTFLEAHVAALRRHTLAEGRPLLCTEWLARGLGSRPATHLPYFARERIGCYHWGLVNGRTQTHLPWPGLESLADRGWHHDLFHPDGRPYDAEEIALFRETLQAERRGSVR
jgi:hypothetical protein